MRGDESTGREPAAGRSPDESGDFFEQLVGSAADAVVTVDADGVLVYVNDAVERLLGYDPDRARGRPVADFVPARFEERYEEWLGRFAASDAGTPFDGDTVEVTLLTADGREKRLSASAFRHDHDGRRLVTGMLREAPDTDAQGDRLREERALVEEIFDTSPIALAVWDADGRLLRANDRAAELVGHGPDGLPYDAERADERDRWTVYDTDGEPLAPEEYPVGRVFETGDPVHNEEVLVERPDGKRVTLSVSAAPIREGGEIRRVVSAAEDITELKRTRDELERRREELETELSEVFNRVTDAFFALNEDWEFTYVNDTAERLLRRTEAELVGRSVWEAFPEAVDTEFERQYRRAMERQEPASFVEYYPPLDAWFEVRAYPSETGLSVYFRDVSERRGRERELERYETIVETVDDGIYVVGPDGTFSMVNPGFEEMTGYDEEYLLGESPSMFYDETVAAAVAEQQREIIAGERSSGTVEHDLETADGETIRIESTFTVREVDGGEYERIGVLRDITEREERERELRWTRKRFEKVFEASRDAIFINDPEADEIVDANPAGCEMLGYSREELLSMGPSDFHPDEMDRFRAFVAEVSEQGSGWTDELTCLHRDGNRIPVEMSASMIAFNDRELMVAIVRDITERKERERELEERNERLDAFASMLAHELRNPLEIAQIYLDSGVERVDVDGDAARSFREVEQALDRIEEMIDTLLVVTRRGGDVDTTEPVALGEAAAEWWEAADPDGRLAVETDRRIRADPSRLRQLFENLYRNAEEHAGPDVTVRVGNLPDGAGFYVADDGPGIPADEREKVFEPGYSTSNVGIGFGLAVVGQLAAAHGWDCEVTESEDGGARFEFRGVETVEE